TWDFGEGWKSELSSPATTYTYWHAGTYSAILTVTDNSGATSGNSNVVTITVAPSTDTTPPTLTNIQVTEITAVSATITWTADEPSYGEVRYGPTTAYDGYAWDYSSLKTNQTVRMYNLKPGTLYHFQVTGLDEVNNTTVSGDYPLTTLPAPVATPMTPERV